MRIGWTLLAILPIVTPAAAGPWSDPEFETMASWADAIAAVEVTEGGRFEAKVRALSVLKGAVPVAPFRLGGFNHDRWPERAIEAEEMKAGERYLVFLYRAGEERGAEGGLWRVPTPSAGDFPIREGRLHGSWLEVGYPRQRPGLDAALAIELVRGLVAHQAGEAPAEARRILAEGLSAEALRAATGEEGALRLEWLLCAQAAYGEKDRGPAVLLAAESAEPRVQRAAARAIASLEPSRAAFDALRRLLAGSDPLVQAEAVETLSVAGFAGEAEEAVLATLGAGDPPEAVLEAVADHFLRFPSARARDRLLELYGRCPPGTVFGYHRYLLREGSDESLEAVANKILLAALSEVDRARAVRQLARSARSGHRVLVQTVPSALNRFRDAEAVRDALVAAAIPAASETVLGLLDEVSGDQIEVVRRAVSLRLSPPEGEAERIDAWFALLAEARPSGEVRSYLLAELVRATPGPRRAEVGRRILAREREIPDPAVLRAIRDLGGTLPPAEAAAVARDEEAFWR